MTSVAPPPIRHRPDLSDDPLARKRLLVVDDHAAVRAGLQDLLADEADFEVVAAVPGAEAAMAIAEREPVDVAVVDYQLGGRNGLWLSRKLKRLREPPAVLIYSAYADGILSAAAVVAEADAIVGKGQLGGELCDMIRSVASGRRQLPPLPPRLAESLRRRLDHQEQAIFGLLLAGVEPSEVAHTLRLPEAELESRLWEMLRRLQNPPPSATA
jgi:DNA-binding NarL/FixJ family response regulator